MNLPAMHQGEIWPRNGNTWFVYCGGPLDNYFEASVPVRVAPVASHAYCGVDRWYIEETAAALAAVEQHPYWDGQMRHEPHLVYVPFTDNHCYIFKLNNNGTTFIASRFRQPWLLSSTAFPGAWEESWAVVVTTAAGPDRRSAHAKEAK